MRGLLIKFSALLILISNIAHAQTPASIVTYLANEGLLVERGDTKILIDPLFRINFGYYQLLPESMEDALFEGQPPFDGVDAIFISHHHADHFSAPDMMRLLSVRPDIKLYAPKQAAAAMRAFANEYDEIVFERVVPIELAYKDAPITLEMEGLLIEVVRIPHSGWPRRVTDVENLSYRVTLDGATTVLHMGDADPNDVHFARDADYWAKTHTHMAFPPIWFFDSPAGQDIVENRISPDHSVGVHVPVEVPDDPAKWPVQYRGFDLFTEPGQTRTILYKK